MLQYTSLFDRTCTNMLFQPLDFQIPLLTTSRFRHSNNKKHIVKSQSSAFQAAIALLGFKLFDCCCVICKCVHKHLWFVLTSGKTRWAGFGHGPSLNGRGERMDRGGIWRALGKPKTKKEEIKEVWKQSENKRARKGSATAEIISVSFQFTSLFGVFSSYVCTSYGFV